MQNLNGYDSPWPAGGGKNKLPNAVAGTQTRNGITLVSHGDGTFTVSGTSTSATNISFDIVDDYVLPVAVDKGGNGCIYLNNSFTTVSNVGVLFVDDQNANHTWGTTSLNRVSSNYSESGQTYKKVGIYVGSGITVSGTFAPMITEDGTKNATTFIPYSNICPISGRTSATVTRTGKNLNPNLGNQFTTNNSIKFYLKAGTYTVSTSDGTAFGAYNAVYFTLLDGDNNTITKGNMQSDRLTLNSSETFYYGGQHFNSITFALLVDAYMLFGFNNKLPAETYSLQLELGSTSTAYAPYNGNEYTIQLGETVYGGTLDVVTGVLTVTWAKKTLNGSEVWGGTPNSGWYTQENNLKKLTSYVGHMMADTLPAGAPGENRLYGYIDINDRYPGENWIYYKNSDMASRVEVDAFFTANPTEVVYDLATPITLTLTPEQISTLQGTNNVWSDVGSITLKYSTKGLTTYLLKP